jgi:hypothetical protein
MVKGNLKDSYFHERRQVTKSFIHSISQSLRSSHARTHKRKNEKDCLCYYASSQNVRFHVQYLNHI